MDYSTPGFSVLHYLPEFAQTYVHWVSDGILWSHPLPPTSPFALIFPSIRVFSNELALCIRWPKYWSFSLSISPSDEYTGWISFRIGWFDLLAVQGTLKSLLQHHINSPVLSFLYGSTLTSVHDYRKNIALIIWTLVSKVMYLLFKTLSSFVIAFLSKSKHLLILWRQSSSAVILECKKIRSVTISTFSPSICHEVMGLDAMILVFEYWVLSQLFNSPLSPSSRGSLVPPHFLQL